MDVHSQSHSTDFETPQIPERWLDLLTGYIEVGLLIAVCVVALMAFLR